MLKFIELNSAVPSCLEVQNQFGATIIHMYD